MTAEAIRLTTSAEASVVEKPDATSRPGPAGFSLVELLVALTVCALLSGAIAAVTPQARAAFDTTPEALDLQQRERTVVDVLMRAVRAAGFLAATRDDGTAGEVAPAVELLDQDGGGDVFHALRVLSVVGHGRGVLESDQTGPSGSLRLLSDANCPSGGAVCGFAKGAVAAVVDVEGGFDVFTIASTSQGAHSISPSHALSATYLTGSAVFEVSADTYYLEAQADGSFTLVRETAAGAVQPIVDNVMELSLQAWRPADPIERVDITVRVDARSTNPRRRVPGRTRRLSVTLRNPS